MVLITHFPIALMTSRSGVRLFVGINGTTFTEGEFFMDGILPILKTIALLFLAALIDSLCEFFDKELMKYSAEAYLRPDSPNCFHGLGFGNIADRLCKSFFSVTKNVECLSK